MTKSFRGWWRFLSILTIASSGWAQLRLEAPAFRQDEASLELGKDEAFLPGEVIYFDCRIGGYKTEGTEVRSIRLSWTVRALDPAGVLLAEPRKGAIKSDLADQDQDYRPRVKYSFPAPLFPWNGVHKVEVLLRDEIAGVETKLEAPFLIRGRISERTPGLGTRNWRFLRREEDDGKGLDPAVYRRGDRVWVRFDLVGFQIGEPNRHSVEYGLVVYGPAGKALLTQEKAAAESDEPSYPARYLPGALNLELKPDSPLGTYTIEFLLRDLISGRSITERRAFSVE